MSTTAALNTNATFSCRGIGKVLWRINGTQVRDASQLTVFANAQVFVPLPRENFSELIVTATRGTNATLVIICQVDPFRGVGDSDGSESVRLLVYGKYMHVRLEHVDGHLMYKISSFLLSSESGSTEYYMTGRSS